MQKQFLEAGQIVNTHGINGEVKVQCWCDSPEVLTDFDTLYWSDGTPVHVERAYVHKGCAILRLEGVSSMDDANALRQKVLYLRRDDIDLPENLVFIQDILHFEVYDLRTARVIGRIRDVLTATAQDLYEIETGDGRLVYIPAVKPFLKSIDLETERVTIASIEGLLE